MYAMSLIRRRGRNRLSIHFAIAQYQIRMIVASTDFCGLESILLVSSAYPPKLMQVKDGVPIIVDSCLY